MTPQMLLNQIHITNGKPIKSQAFNSQAVNSQAFNSQAVNCQAFNSQAVNCQAMTSKQNQIMMISMPVAQLVRNNIKSTF